MGLRRWLKGGRTVPDSSPAARGGPPVDLGLMGKGREEALGRPQLHVARPSSPLGVRCFLPHLYAGDCLLLDFSSLAADPEALQELSLQLEPVLEETRACVVPVGETRLILAPVGISVRSLEHARGP